MDPNKGLIGNFEYLRWFGNPLSEICYSSPVTYKHICSFLEVCVGVSGK